MERGKEEVAKQFCRHDYVMVNRDGRCRAYRQILTENPSLDLTELLFPPSGDRRIPAIVSRQAEFREGSLQVGWSSWQRKDGTRLRFPARIPLGDIERVVSPYEVFLREEDWPTPFASELSAIRALSETCQVRVGLIGAVGMETLTGKPYTHENSDLDLIVCGEEGGDLKRFADGVERIGRHRVDLELELPCGGVKLKEWLSPQKTVLIKSLWGISIEEKETLLGKNGTQE